MFLGHSWNSLLVCFPILVVHFLKFFHQRKIAMAENLNGINPIRFEQTPDTRYFMCRHCRNHVMSWENYIGQVINLPLSIYLSIFICLRILKCLNFVETTFFTKISRFFFSYWYINCFLCSFMGLLVLTLQGNICISLYIMHKINRKKCMPRMIGNLTV